MPQKIERYQLRFYGAEIKLWKKLRKMAIDRCTTTRELVVEAIQSMVNNGGN